MQKWRLLLYQFFYFLFFNSYMRIVENFDLPDVEAKGPEVGPVTTIFQFF
jgi:hypothetical protein